MKERERVFELVRKGIISTEEALVLLENMAREKDENIINKEAIDVKKQSAPVTKEKPSIDEQILGSESVDMDEEQEKAFHQFEENEEADRKRLEEILDELATQANKASAELDEINVEIAGLKQEIKEKEEQLMVLNTLEELDTLTEEKLEERKKVEEEKRALEFSLVELENEKEIHEEKLKSIRKEQKEESKAHWSDVFDMPEDWKETASDSFNQLGEKLGDAGNQLGKFLKQTVKTVADTVNENIDWKDVNIKVPGVVSSSFEHEFMYPDCYASLIDVKVANGEVKFQTWNQDHLKVAATIKLYGKMSADTPFEAFLERSQIEVDDEKISFQIPNKRVKAELVFYLPERMYDHISIKVLNGDVELESVEAKDVYVKSTNGDMNFDKLIATMLEVEGVNGDIKVTDSDIMDYLAESVNGDFVVKAKVQNYSISNVNGDIKITAQKDGLKKIEAKVVNGTLKVSLPKEVGVEAMAKTSIGSIKNRMEDFEIIREKNEKTNQLLQLRRLNEEQTVYVQLSTTTGSIYLKDSEN